MARWRRAVELAMTGEEIERLTALSRSRTEPAGRVSRAAMLLGYREKPSFFAVGRRLGVHHQTVQRCVERAMAYGALAALDDRPRPGKEPTITPEAKAWLVSLACDKAKEHGYPHELWTTRLLARHARERGPAAGHQCLARLAQGTVCKLLGQEEIKPHKVRYYLERRDAEFEPKMAEVLCVYREVQVLKKAAAKAEKSKKPVAIVSYDEKPGIQAIATTAPDLPPVPGRHASFARDHEYKRHGTLSLLAGIDLLTGKVHALVRERHRSREFIEFLKLLDAAYPASTAIKLILDNHSIARASCRRCLYRPARADWPGRRSVNKSPPQRQPRAATGSRPLRNPAGGVDAPICDDRPRPGKEPTITPEAKAWLVSLACDKAKEHGYPHELWTTRLLARHARERGPAAGHQCLARLAQGTVCKLLGQEEIKPHKVRYYLERRDAEFEPKMAEVLCVYREVQVLKKAAAKAEKSKKPVAIVSYDEKPGIQAIATTAPDLPPVPGRHASFARDHEYKRHGTLSLLAGIDLLTGKVHALVRERHRSREFIEFLKLLDAAYPASTAIKLILDNHSIARASCRRCLYRPARADWPGRRSVNKSPPQRQPRAATGSRPLRNPAGGVDAPICIVQRRRSGILPRPSYLRTLRCIFGLGLTARVNYSLETTHR